MNHHRATYATTSVLVALGAAFVAAGGYVHATQWWDTYRDVPAAVPGSAVVRIGFPVNVMVSIVLAVALFAVAARPRRRFALLGVALAAGFECGSLGILILSRTSSVLGWKETGWTSGANQARAFELGAILSLGIAAALLAGHGERRQPDD